MTYERVLGFWKERYVEKVTKAAASRQETTKSPLDLLVDYGIRFHISEERDELILNYYNKPRSYFELAIPRHPIIGRIESLYCGSALKIHLADSDFEGNEKDIVHYIHDEQVLTLDMDAAQNSITQWKLQMQQETIDREFRFWLEQQEITLKRFTDTHKIDGESYLKHHVLLLRQEQLLWSSDQMQIPMCDLHMTFPLVDTEGFLQEGAQPALSYVRWDTLATETLDLTRFVRDKKAYEEQKIDYNSPERYRKLNPL